MRVTQLRTQTQLLHLRLSDSLALCRSQDLLWAPSGQRIVVRYGCAWATEDTVSARELELEWAHGLVFVDVQAGTHTQLDLPSQDTLVLAGHPLQCAMSATDSLLVLHADNKDDLCLSVYSPSGSLAATTAICALGTLAACDNLQPSCLCWASDSRAVALHLASTDAVESDQLCVWFPFSPSSMHTISMGSGLAPDGFGQLVWAPCSTKLLVQLSPSASVIYSRDLQVLSQSGAERRHPAWGVSGVLSLGSVREELTLRRCYISVNRALHLCPVQGGELQPLCLSIELGTRVTELHSATISSDGSRCATVTWQLQPASPAAPDDGPCLTEPVLEIISLTAGRRVQLPLAHASEHRNFSVGGFDEIKTTADPNWASYSMRWAADGSELLCSTREGDGHLLVSFL